MNGSLNWLDAWKAKADNKRQRLAQALSRKPVNPAMASIRDLYLKRAQNAVSTHQNWAEAYVAHVKGIASIVSAKPAASGAASKGSLGDAG
jgi:hypothetical protein